MARVNYSETFFKDLHYGLRVIGRRPGFAFVAMVTLALGIGANTAIFSLVNGILLRPLPYTDSDRLVRLTQDYPKGAFDILRNQCQSMDLAAYWPGEEFNLADFGGTPIRVTGAEVSADFFSILGVRPRMGRTFHSGEDAAGNNNVVILSAGLLEEQFGGDPFIIGRSITLEGQTRQVVGVMRPDFRFPSADTKLWVPLALDPRNTGDFWGPQMPVVGRLRPGATTEHARLEVKGLIPTIVGSSPYPLPSNWNSTASVISLQEDVVGNIRAKLLILLGAVGLVLLMACANVANLMLARSSTRNKEVAMRVALGASRSRIIRQLLTESVLLALGGGAVGLLIAAEGLVLLKSLLPADTPRLADADLDWRVLTFTLVLSLLTGVVFGLAPALSATRVNLIQSLNAGGRRSAGSRAGRLNNALVVIEIGLAVVLVIGAGLLLKSLWLLARANPGFNTERILTVDVTPNKGFGTDRGQCLALYDELLRRLESLPGVENAAAINSLPLTGDVPVLPVSVSDYHPERADAQAPLVWAGAVTSGYCEIVGIPVLQGRNFNNDDRVDTAGVVMVTASTARTLWPGEDPVGKHIKPVWDKQWRTVVGVVADVKQYGLAKGRPDWLTGEIYMPYAQAILGHKQFPASMTVVLRVASEEVPIGNQVRQIVESLNPDVPVSNVRTLRAVVSESIATPNSTTWLFSVFAALALLLGAVGIYSLISYSVAERTHEVGVRMALGADRSDVLKLVVWEGMVLTGAGIGFGIAAAVGLTQLLSSLLYDVKPIDLVTFAAVPVVLSAVALLASYIPARRATKVDPMVALRFE